MDDDFKEKLKAQYESLPEEVKRAIRETDIRGILADIAQKHDLRIDQAGALEDETMFVMLGLERPDDFVKNVRENLSLTLEAATSLAQDVDEKLLRSVKQTLMGLAPEQAHEQTADKPGLAQMKLQETVHAPAITKPVAGGRYVGTDPYRELPE